MDRIGRRELRHNLRGYLPRVEAGEGFEVTVFGRPVAQPRPVGEGAPTRAELIADGRVAPPANRDTSALPEPVAAITNTSATTALLAERRTDLR